jgi:hypothetical protein
MVGVEAEVASVVATKEAEADEAADEMMIALTLIATDLEAMAWPAAASVEVTVVATEAASVEELVEMTTCAEVKTSVTETT